MFNVTHYDKPTKIENIIVFVAGRVLDLNDQRNIVIESPFLTQDDAQGYDFSELVGITMDEYNLDSDCGIQVDYWSNSMQMYVICENYFPRRLTSQDS